MATNTSSQDLKALGINLVKSKAAWQQMLAAGNIIKPDEFYLVQGDEATTYAFANGDNGTFIVTPSDGTAQTINVITDYLRVSKGGTGRNEAFNGNKILLSAANGQSIVEGGTFGATNTPIWIDGGVPKAITSYNGKASTASALDPGATIALSGAITGTATTFTGASPITIPTTGINFNATDITISGTLSISNGGTNNSEALVKSRLIYSTNENSTRMFSSGIEVTGTGTALTITGASGASGEYIAKRGTYQMFMGFGSGNKNHGLYSNVKNDWIVYCDENGSVTLNGNAASASTATQLTTGRTLKVNLSSSNASTAFNGTANVHDIGVDGVLPISKGGTNRSEAFGANKLIKVNNANNALEPVGTVGGTATPVYSNAGVLTAFSSNIGGTSQPVYVKSGAITAITSNIGGAKQPIYMSSGVLTASTANEGGSTLPVYLKNGVLTEIDYLDTAHGGTGRSEALPTNALLAGDSSGASIVKAAETGSETVPIYINSNGIATSTSPSKFEVKNAKYLKLYEARGTTTSLNKTANYVEAGAMFHLVASSSTTIGKTPTDANILQMNWDNNGGYDGQFGIATSGGRAYFRSRASAGDTWQEVAHAPVGNAVGGTAAPVYMSSTGIITVIDAVDFGHGGTGYAGNYTANALIKVNSTNTAFEAVGGIGSSKKFVYTNSNGVLTATTESIGASNKPIYMDSGEIKASTSNIGGTKTPIYMTSGTLTASNATEGSSSLPVYLNGGTLTAITTLGTLYGGTGISEAPTANRVAWSNASSQLTSSSMYTDGSRLGVNRTSISSTDYKFEVTGISRFQGATLFSPTSDAVLKIYNVTNTTYGNETIAIQTTFDNVDPETSNYVTQYESRCNLLLQPRGGQVYIGENLTSVGSTNYSLLVTGASRFNDIHPSTTSSSDSTGYNIGSTSYRWNYVYARNLNLDNNATISNNLTVSGNTFFNNEDTIVQNGSAWTAANIFKGGTLFSAVTDATTHTSDGALVVLGGVNIAKTLRTAGDIVLYTANNDRSIIFGYSNTTAVNNNTDKSWRIAYLGSGADNTDNYLVVDASTANNTWTRVMRAAMDTLDVGFGGAIYPLVTYDSSNHTNQNIGSRSLIWSDLFANRANVKYIQPYTKSLTSSIDNIIELQGSGGSSTGIQSSMYLQTTYSQPAFYPNDDKQGSLGLPDQRWGSLYVGEFAADYTYTKTSGITI